MGVHEHEMEVFTRGIQANIGMGFGVLAFAVAMGALFSVAFIVAYSRFAITSVRAQSLVLAAGAFTAVYLVPFLKYPANPPSIGDPDTIGKRTGLYLLMIGLSLAFAVAAVWLGRRLLPKLGAWGATLSGIGAYVVVMAVVMLVLPPVSEVPQPLLNDQGAIMYPGFSADDLYQFRLYAVGTQLIVWATIGLVLRRHGVPSGGHQGKGDARGVSEVVRLTLVSHAMTDAMSAGRFPTDEPLNAVGHRQVDASIDLGVTERAYCGPEKRTRQTAELLGLHASIDNRLADLDCGRWRGDVVGGVQSDDLAIWLTDPTRAPHGGESVVELIERVRGWMDSLTTRRTRLVVVTHPSVIRAAILVALNAPPKSFWRIDIAPVSRTVMHFRGHAWTLRSSL